MLVLTSVVTIGRGTEIGAAAVSHPTDMQLLNRALTRTMSSRSLILHLTRQPLTRGSSSVSELTLVYGGPRDFYYAESRGRATYKVWGVGHWRYQTAAGIFLNHLSVRNGKLVTRSPSAADIRRATAQLAGKYVRSSLDPANNGAPQRFAGLSIIRDRLSARYSLVVHRAGGAFVFRSASMAGISGVARLRDGLVVSVQLRVPKDVVDTVTYTDLNGPVRVDPPPSRDLVAVDPSTDCIAEIKYTCVH
jgi:hypothetical protein